MATTRTKKDMATLKVEGAGVQSVTNIRTAPATARLNFEIPTELLRGIKIAAALQDSTIRLTVIQILDQWLKDNPEFASFTYGGVDVIGE